MIIRVISKRVISHTPRIFAQVENSDTRTNNGKLLSILANKQVKLNIREMKMFVPSRDDALRYHREKIVTKLKQSRQSRIRIFL
jgi:hypothetical protein